MGLEHQIRIRAYTTAGDNWLYVAVKIDESYIWIYVALRRPNLWQKPTRNLDSSIALSIVEKVYVTKHFK